MANKQILNDSGEPFHPKREEHEANLPAGVQALIETRISSAIENLRELNRNDLQRLESDHTRKWRWIALISCIVTVISWFLQGVTWFYAPDKVRDWISDQVDTKLTEPALQESVDRVMKNKMEDFVSAKLEPLDERAKQLGRTIDDMNAVITSKQAAIEDQQKGLANQLRIQNLAIAAKAGSRQAYSTLLGLHETEPDANSLLKTSIKEIELFYDADRGQLMVPILVDAETLTNTGYSVDEAVLRLKNRQDLAEAAINVLSELKSKGAVRELCNIVAETNDLRAAARATRALEIITEEKIRPLDFQKVQTWWRVNQANKTYLGDYDGYCQALKQIFPTQGEIRVPANEILAGLSKTIESDPQALHSMCLKAGVLATLGNLDEAKSLLDTVRKSRSDYRWLNVFGAVVKVREKDYTGAITDLNTAFKKSPTRDVEAVVRSWIAFAPIVADPNIEWPSKRTAK